MSESTPRDDAGRFCAIMGFIIAALVVIAVVIGTIIGRGGL